MMELTPFMQTLKDLSIIIIGAVLVNNYVMNRFLGICAFIGVSKRITTALGMGMAVTFVMALSSLLTWVIHYYLLIPLNLEYLRTIAFVLVIAVLVQMVEMALKKLSFLLYQAMGVYLPLITTNCIVLGVAIINVNSGYGLIESVVNGTAAALGFTLAIVLFAGIREKLALNGNMPKWMDGFAGALVTAGIMSLAFMGFSGLV